MLFCTKVRFDSAFYLLLLNSFSILFLNTLKMSSRGPIALGRIQSGFLKWCFGGSSSYSPHNFLMKHLVLMSSLNPTKLFETSFFFMLLHCRQNPTPNPRSLADVFRALLIVVRSWHAILLFHKWYSFSAMLPIFSLMFFYISFLISTFIPWSFKQ